MSKGMLNEREEE